MSAEEEAKKALKRARASAGEAAEPIPAAEPVKVDILGWEPEDGPRPAMNIWQKLAWVQKRIAVPKGRGRGHDPNAKVEYSFRNASDILSRVKPLCFAVDAMVVADTKPQVFAEGATDHLVTVRKGFGGKEDTVAVFGGQWRLLVASARFYDIETGKSIECTSAAEQDYWRKGQSEPEKRSGSTDSYSTKYALCHIFAIDDNQDADELSSRGTIGPKAQTATAEAAEF